jgi:hypothetical protein
MFNHSETLPTDFAALRRHLLAAENAIIDINRALTDAIIAKRPVGRLYDELEEVMEQRDQARESLKRLGGNIGKQEQLRGVRHG